jgi:hypothetical protein
MMVAVFVFVVIGRLPGERPVVQERTVLVMGVKTRPESHVPVATNTHDQARGYTHHQAQTYECRNVPVAPSHLGCLV